MPPSHSRHLGRRGAVGPVDGGSMTAVTGPRPAGRTGAGSGGSRAGAGSGGSRAGAGSGGSRTLAELGEFGLISAIAARMPSGPEVALGPGDDAAVVLVPDGRVVVTTDVLVEGVHFRQDWSEPADVGHKAAAQNMADVAAMGARPIALVAAIGAPGSLKASWILSLADGLAAEAGRGGAAVVGGDVVAAEQIVVSVTAIGSLDGRPAITRAGARPGDVVAVRGRLGWSAAGLAVLARGFRSPRALVAAHRRPEPDYSAGPVAAAHGATSMIDTSDGLLADLAHVAEASDVVIQLDASAFDIPQPLRDAAAALGRDPLEWVVTGGEDHALVATFRASEDVPDGWTVLGRAIEVPQLGDAAPVTVSGLPSGVYTGPAGWRHFAADRP
jgi:thiamine-monophosphate kinase